MFNLFPFVLLNTILLHRFSCRFLIAKLLCSFPNCHCICPCVNCRRICPGTFAIVSALAQIWLCMFANIFALRKSILQHCGLANLQSTWIQCSLQDCCLVALQSILVPIIIAQLCSQSTLGQKLSHNLPLSLWRVTFAQPAIIPSVPDRSALRLFTFPSSSYTLSFVFSR